jgi:hypothetical protein
LLLVKVHHVLGIRKYMDHTKPKYFSVISRLKTPTKIWHALEDCSGLFKTITWLILLLYSFTCSQSYFSYSDNNLRRGF